MTNCSKPGVAENLTSDWIVVNPFNRTNSNDMIANATNYTHSRIIGLIFISDSDITAQKVYENPKMISRVATSYTLEL